MIIVRRLARIPSHLRLGATVLGLALGLNSLLLASPAFALDYTLDLFSGVGSFGIECLSRGVKHVVFFENYKGVLPILKRNLKSLKKLTNYEIIEKDIYRRPAFLSLKKKFDIIYIDPPYKDKNLDKLLFSIREEEILNKKGIIIIHRHKNEKVSFNDNFKILEEKKYGISKIIFLKFLN